MNKLYKNILLAAGGLAFFSVIAFIHFSIKKHRIEIQKEIETQIQKKVEYTSDQLTIVDLRNSKTFDSIDILRSKAIKNANFKIGNKSSIPLPALFVNSNNSQIFLRQHYLQLTWFNLDLLKYSDLLNDSIDVYKRYLPVNKTIGILGDFNNRYYEVKSKQTNNESLKREYGSQKIAYDYSTANSILCLFGEQFSIHKYFLLTENGWTEYPEDINISLIRSVVLLDGPTNEHIGNYTNGEKGYRTEIRLCALSLPDYKILTTHNFVGYPPREIIRYSGDSTKYCELGIRDAVRDASELLNLSKYVSNTDLYNALYNLLNAN